MIERIRGGELLGFAELRESLLSLFPLLGRMEETPQDPEWHGEGNVAIHTAMVLTEIQKGLGNASPDQRVIMTLAVLFHDIAKSLVTREAEVRGALRIISPRHAEKGRNYLALRLPDLGLSGELQNEILSLVGYHHHPRKLVLNEDACGKYAQLARMVDFPSVIALEEADLYGRICPDLDGQLEQLEWFRLQGEEYASSTPSDIGWMKAMRDAFPKQNESFHQHAASQSRRDFEDGRIQSIEEAVARAYQLRDTPAIVTILSGPSGSGKSTWVEKFGKNTAVVSLDLLREKIAGKRSDQSKNGQVLQAAKEALKVKLRAGESVIWDATNTRKDGRRWVASLGYDYGAYVRIVAFRNSINTLHSRNRKRADPISAAVQEKQIKSFEWPTLDEAHEVLIH